VDPGSVGTQRIRFILTVNSGIESRTAFSFVLTIDIQVSEIQKGKLKAVWALGYAALSVLRILLFKVLLNILGMILQITIPTY